MAGHADDAARAACYVAEMFAPVEGLEPGAVSKALAEAREIFDGLPG